MHKIKPGTFVAGTIESNFKGTIESFVARNITFSFMSSVKETPAYWKQFLNDVLAMVKQLGIPTYFLTLSCADLRREELPYIINKLNSLGLRDEDLKSLSCEERSNLLKHNPVFVARHFQYKVVFFLSWNIMLFILNFKKKLAHMSFHSYGFSMHEYWKRNCLTNTQLLDHLTDLELFELVKTYQVYVHRRTCWKYYKNECPFSYGRYFTEKTIITKPLDSKFSNEEKQKILTWRNTLLRQAKSYIDNAK